MSKFLSIWYVFKKNILLLKKIILLKFSDEDIISFCSDCKWAHDYKKESFCFHSYIFILWESRLFLMHYNNITLKAFFFFFFLVSRYYPLSCWALQIFYIKRALTIRSWCKLAILQHLITNWHIITLRKIQKTKVKTNTTNQNEEKNKNNPDWRDPEPWVWQDLQRVDVTHRFGYDPTQNRL